MNHHSIVDIEADLIKANEKIALLNKVLLDKNNVKAIDIMGAIGSGKTTLIEVLCEKLKEKYRIKMIAGDISTDIDAERVKKHGVTAYQINTGRECHLDAHLIQHTLEEISLKDTDLLFIENVGNLICPADFVLGTHIKVVVISVTEGPYVVIKHPVIMKMADILIINKIDLAEAMEVDIEKLTADAKKINPSIKVIPTIAKTGQGIPELIRALEL